MVDGCSLENYRARERTVGSNPTRSASIYSKHWFLKEFLKIILRFPPSFPPKWKALAVATIGSSDAWLGRLRGCR